MLDRDGQIYKGVSCSDSLYDHKKHLNLYHPYQAGIHQFGKSAVKRGDDEKLLMRMKLY
jgi:hypothetical protein